MVLDIFRNIKLHPILRLKNIQKKLIYIQSLGYIQKNWITFNVLVCIQKIVLFRTEISIKNVAQNFFQRRMYVHL